MKYSAIGLISKLVSVPAPAGGGGAVMGARHYGGPGGGTGAFRGAAPTGALGGMSAAAATGPSTVVYVTVEGALDRVATGREIVNIVREYGAATGTQVSLEMR
jgi:hypothetical protein